MQNKLAPIGLTVYRRLQHLQQAVAALQKNLLASQSELYVFSDAPKPGDEKEVAAVRSYLRTIDGFRKVYIIERENNSRIANNRGGMQMLLDRFGKLIWLAEDVVTAPGFLQFMNGALEFYGNTEKVGSISGYCPPFELPQEYPRDFFSLTRFNPWGFGLWKRYYKMDTPIGEQEFNKIFKSKEKMNDLVRCAGEEAADIIQMDFKGKLDAGDMKTIFWQFMDKKLTIYPKKSLTRNIGLDGSGFHMPLTYKWDVSELWNKVGGFNFSQEIEVDERIEKAHSEFYKIPKSKFAKAVYILNRIGIYKYIRPSVRKLRALWQSKLWVSRLPK